jgi:hypothetical protein
LSRDDGGSNRQFALSLTSGGAIESVPAISVVKTSATTGLNNNVWHHVAWYQDSSGNGGWVIDGVNSTYTGGAAFPSNPNTVLEIGAWSPAGQNWHGDMCLLAMFNRVLTVSQIQAHRAAAF